MEIKIYPDPILLENCKDVVNIDEDLVSTVKEMINIMRSVDGIGLAAPQVGIWLLYTSPSPRDGLLSRMPSSA